MSRDKAHAASSEPRIDDAGRPNVPIILPSTGIPANAIAEMAEVVS